MSRRDELAGQGLIVLDAAQHPETARITDGLEGRGGHILHRYGTHVLIGDVPASAAKGITDTRGVSGYHTGALEERPRRLSETEALGVSAWNLRQSRGFATAKKSRPHDRLRWDATGFAAGPLPPDGPGMEHVTEVEPVRGLFGDDMSQYLIGSVALGLLMVEGPTAELQFSEAERTKVVAEVQEGLGWLAQQEPRASVTFAYDIRVARVNVAPDPNLSGYDALEARWRDPAMATLVFAPNYLGVVNYVSTLRRKLGTRWGYAAFFTKYPLQHFAYALRPRLVMQYENDGWGVDNIDRVMTHETGHIFGCPDEYSSANCTCDARFGYLREPNGNCQRCTTGFVDCLMCINTWAMCPHTPVQLGWRDTDGDGRSARRRGAGRRTGASRVRPVERPPARADRRRDATRRGGGRGRAKAIPRGARAQAPRCRRPDQARRAGAQVTAEAGDILMVAAQGASVDGIVAWIGAGGAPAADLELRVGDQRYPLRDQWTRFAARGGDVNAQRITISGLPPGHAYTLQLVAHGEVVASAEASTLPPALPSDPDRPFTVLFGSCFSVAQDPACLVGAAVARLPSFARPSVTILAGDQVYVDSPAMHFLLHTHTKDDLADELRSRY